MMPAAIPVQWRYAPPRSLVVGDGPYAKALATTLGTASLSLSDLAVGPARNDRGGYPRVFEGLTRVLLVVPEGAVPVDAIGCHRAVWYWVEEISSLGEEHELAFFFVLPADAPASSEKSLAIGLGISAMDPATTGHAAWRRSGSLSGMLELLASVRPIDLLLLRARRRVNARHAAIAQLCSAMVANDLSEGREAVREVLGVFAGQEYQLDLFCRPPSHQHGNYLRAWLNGAVTDPGTQEWWNVGSEHIGDWLVQQPREHRT